MTDREMLMFIYGAFKAIAKTEGALHAVKMLEKHLFSEAPKPIPSPTRKGAESE